MQCFLEYAMDNENQEFGYVYQYFPHEFPFDIKMVSANPIKMAIFYKNKPIYSITNETPLNDDKDRREAISLMTRTLMDTIDKGFADRIVNNSGN